ncbi:MAG: ImcF-related family protein, partial [Pseudomonadota bacterium]
FFGLMASFDNNRQYLATIGARTKGLTQQIKTQFADFKSAQVPDVLNATRELPGYATLDVDNPPRSFLYGLYAVPPVLDAARQTYAQVQDQTLLPFILARMEAVLAQSVQAQDANTAYATLRVYKLLHDRAHYMQDGGARDVRNWVLKDWETTDSASAFGGRASMIDHVQALFSGERTVQAATLPNEALVREVQSFLNSQTSTQRVYERAKAAMQQEAPQEFTLVRAVGPQAGTVFSRTEGQPLEKGVPGLFTYDGYHGLFNKRLPEFVGLALEDDAWVMGRMGAGTADGFATGLGKVGGTASRVLQDSPLLDDVRRQYLDEYAGHWERFLDSVRTVSGSDTTGTSLGFDLSVLRQFAAPDSPLSRLARAVTRETTLSRPLVTQAPDDKSFFDKATDQLNQKTRELSKNLGIRSEERLEKQLVDNRFAALREVVTGQADAGTAAIGGAKPGLEAISGLVNEFYTLLVVADTALTANSLPPGGAEIGAKLKLEAGKLPAPFREVLTALATSGSDKVTQGATLILRKQAQVQFDRIMGLMSLQVSELCRRGVEGRYPLAAVAQDVAVEDFTQLFATGGAADEFFNRYLASFVDNSVRPWRYKSPDSANAMVGAEGLAVGATPAPATVGPTMVGELLKLLAQGGPNLDLFYRAQQIRELFFRDAGGRKMAWKMDLRVQELEPSVTDLIIDIDGQGQRYVHGPVQTLTVNWPGLRGGAMAELTANPRISGATSTVAASGPWALFRLMEKGRIVGTATPGHQSVEFAFDGRKAVLDISAGSQPNPLNSDVLKGFRCSGRPS